MSSPENPTLDKMRKGLQALEEMEIPMDPAFFDKMHDKIMEKIEDSVIEPAPALMAPRRFLRAHWRGWLYPTGGTMALALAMTLVAMQFAKTNSGHVLTAKLNNSGEKVVAAALASPDTIAQTLLSSESEADFFVDVASQSFENLNISQFNKIMGEDRR